MEPTAKVKDTPKIAPYAVYDGSGGTFGGLFCSDALDFLSILYDESADIVFLDPPFNLGKDYNDEKSLDNKAEAEYLDWMAEILTQATRVLKPGGALFLYHLPIWAIRLGSLLENSLSFRHWIAVSMKNGFARGQRLYPAHYALLYYTKGGPRHFNRPREKIQVCRHCGQPIKDYGGYKKIIEQKGVNLSDVWDDLSPVRHSSTKTRIANELPFKFTDRIVEISGSRGGVYVDPFAGAGGGIISAAKHGMTFYGNDVVSDNCDVIKARLTDLQHATGKE